MVNLLSLCNFVRTCTFCTFGRPRFATLSLIVMFAISHYDFVFMNNG